MKFRINLATKLYIDTTRLRLILSASLVIMSALLVLNIRTLTGNYEEAGRITRDIAEQNAKFKLASKGVSEKAYQELLGKISFANSLIQKKTYNWLILLDNLELVVPDGLAITSIEPDQSGHGLRLAGIARGFSKLQSFLEHLEGSSYFTDVYLSSQVNQKLKDNSQGIVFSVNCRVAMK
jgi:type IV pilus assembly protein PilN